MHISPSVDKWFSPTYYFLNMASERLKRQTNRLLDEAEQAFANREWDVVRQRARDVLAFDPGNKDAEAFLAGAERALESESIPATVDNTAAPTSPATKTEATTFANGRYQVKDFLGEGGKKKVYLAHDSVLDRNVALARCKNRRPR